MGPEEAEVVFEERALVNQTRRRECGLRVRVDEREH
jgi:hypothetical protein